MSNIMDFDNAGYQASQFFYQRPVEQGQNFGERLTSTGVDAWPTYVDYDTPENSFTQSSYPMSSYTVTPPGPIPTPYGSVISGIVTLVILGVIVYLAVKNPAELTTLFKTYVYLVLGALLIMAVLALILSVVYKL